MILNFYHNTTFDILYSNIELLLNKIEDGTLYFNFQEIVKDPIYNIDILGVVKSIDISNFTAKLNIHNYKHEVECLDNLGLFLIFDNDIFKYAILDITKNYKYYVRNTKLSKLLKN